MSCRWDGDAKKYLRPDGDECTHDEYGDRTRHCTARRRCNAHVGPEELTCPACIGKVRTRLARVVELMALMPAAALEAERVDTEAMSLAAGSGDPVVLSWRRIDKARATGGVQADDSEEDPGVVLGRWQHMLSEDYDDDLGERVTLTSAVKYLDRVLVKVAQDPEQDFALLMGEVTGMCKRLERVLSVAPVKQTGLPCPWCETPRRMAWVEGAAEALDWWRCPDNREHWMGSADYNEWADARTKVSRVPGRVEIRERMEA